MKLAAVVATRIVTSSAPLSITEIASATRRFAPVTVTDAGWQDQIDAAWQHARSAGYLGAERASPDSHAVPDILGIPGTPTWMQIADRWLPLVALGVSLADSKVVGRFKNRDAWTAAIAGRLLGLWVAGPPPSLAAVCDAHAWRHLGLTGRPKRCPPEIRALYFQRAMHVETAAPDRLLRLYVARELGAPRPELRSLRDALVRRWLLADTDPPRLSPGTSSFQAAVLATARAMTEGRFGDRKVFISAVWEHLRGGSGAPSTFEAFKAQLIDAQRHGPLVLARADLVAAMDPALVMASETVADGATFHFIVLEDAA